MMSPLVAWNICTLPTDQGGLDLIDAQSQRVALTGMGDTTCGR